MTSSIQARPISPSRSSSTTTFHPTTANTSTSSLTLVDTQPTFSPPPRTGTDSSASSNSTVTSQSTVFSQASAPRVLRAATPSRPSQAAVLRAREADRARQARDLKMANRRAEALRGKGTYTDAGRHSDDWLFGGWSFKNSVRGAWRLVKGGPNGE